MACKTRSGRLFYLHYYKTALLAEGYMMSAFDNCLFYCITATDTNYIIVYVDDTFIFSNSPVHIDTVITNVGKHYEVTLDRDATSSLGLNLTHNSSQSPNPSSSPNSSHSIRQKKTLRTSHRTHIPIGPTTPTRRPLHLFATSRYTSLSHQEPPGYHGRGIIRRNEEQQPHQS